MINKIVNKFKEIGLRRFIIGAISYTWTNSSLCKWSKKDHPFLGMFVGDYSKVEGLTFFVGNSLVSNALKSKFLLNRYEPQERLALQFVNPELPTIEVGGCMGIISCILNKKLKNPVHIVVEANPNVVPILERNRALNKCNFTIINKALGYHPYVELKLQDEFLKSSAVLDYDVKYRSIQVPTITLKELSAPFHKINLVCDMEGMEYEILKNELEIMKNKVAIFIAEFHASGRNDPRLIEALIILKNSGFELINERKYTYVFRNTVG
ncbi:MAG: FkbM family methyltransferase [Candidatus Taylorbacteria bacterium]|nr:FkbM family methyltransferase [Candidatus Taylorbacteria bacterium]